MKSLQPLITGLVLLLACANVAAAENVLRFRGKDAGATTLDPHSYDNPDNDGATKQVYEALLDIDSNLAIVPQLASAWEPVDTTTWEFELRQGVRFHDGKPFTSDDVVFSLERAREPTSDYRDYASGIAAVEAIGDHAVRVKTTGPDPLFWLKLSSIAIMSRAWAQEHGVEKPADYVGVRQETYASRHADGTGPFTVEAFEPRGDYALVRNPDWWGRADYPHNIDRVVHIMKGEADSVAALLTGEIDLLQTVSYEGLDTIRRDPDLKLAYRPKLHTVFFSLDQGSTELRSANIKGRNPFKDRRVRQAMAHAIDVEPILRGLMGELLIPAGMMAAPGVNGYVPELDRPAPHDPQKARALLAEAGYPDGFSVALDCANDWGDDEIATCKGVAEQLSIIGIRVVVNFMPTDTYEAKCYKGPQCDFRLDGWHMGPDPEKFLKDLYGSHSMWNFSGYANPQVDELIGKMATDMVTYARDAYIEEAWRIVTDDLVYLPIRHGVSVFAMRRSLEIPPDPWDVPRFRLARLEPDKAR